MTFLEFFAGGGMARLGLEGAFDCIFANDNNADKADAYSANFPDSHFKQCDIAALKPADIPTADLAWASFPCQDLSSAGARRGLNGQRSGTFWTFWNLMQGLANDGRGPSIIVLENVTGLLSSHRGADFALLVETITKAGYRVGALVLDAADFVPQSRQRLFLVATRLKIPAACLLQGPGNFHSSQLIKAVDGLSETARQAWYWWALSPPPRSKLRLLDMLDAQTPQTAWYPKAKLARLLGQMTPLHRARVEAACANGAPRVGAVYRRIRGGIQRAEVRYDGVAGCLRTLKGGSSRQLLLCSEAGQLRLRAMSPSEAGRLMGLPERYALPAGATRAINLCGDGVCVPVVAWLATELLEPLARQSGFSPQKRVNTVQVC